MIGGDGDGSGDNGGEKMIGGTVMVEMVMAHGGGMVGMAVMKLTNFSQP